MKFPQKGKKTFISVIVLLFIVSPAALFAASVSAPITKNLTPGMQSPQVVFLQDTLKELGFLPVSQASTGYYGKTTRTAVMVYQKQNQIPTTGTVGPATRASLLSAQKFEFSAWLPYWRKATSTAETLAHLSTFSEISPFSYNVKKDGTLVDTAKIIEEPWISLITAAKSQKVKVIPTILWGDTNAIYIDLKTRTTRLAHEKAIAKLVDDNNFDGIDIDYEGKSAETKPYFSAFLKELSAMLHKAKKSLVCTIEPRTPLDSRFINIPANVEYANDYTALNSSCDEVRLMAYDQMVVDLKLNQEKGSLGTYAPVADPLWVEKVANVAAESISLRKIVIGVPTYGYEFKVTPDGTSFDYDRQNAINPVDALALAKDVGATPQRNSAGEMSFTYFNSVDGATSTATTTQKTFRMVWWSDASAIADKVALAKKLGVRGVVLFKIDGGEDQGIWSILR